jgi:ASPIC and UnbV/FG-GAP-like repeat
VRRTLLPLGLTLATILALGSSALATPQSAPSAPTPPSPIRFEEIGAAVGARYLHHPRKFAGKNADVLEMFTEGGATVAVGDYDGDGDLDIFLTDSDTGSPNHLLRNQLAETGALRFVDVAAEAGVAGGNEPHAIVSDAVWFDADGDGSPDLLVARFGTPLLYRNLGGGRFADVSAGSGLTAFANTIAVIAFDYDGDGRLDLLFGNYFRPLDLTALTTPHILPNDLDDAVNGGGVTLWRNLTAAGGPLRFVDVTAQAGLAGTTGWTLDVGHGDFDGDGRPDLYLADDYGTDRLYLNAGPDAAGVVRFRDVTERTLGFDTKKGMNAEIADYDRDGRLDVYVTNITDEYMRECNMLWHNDGPGPDGVPVFTDVARESGTCNTLWGWAAKFGDFDDDGWLDLFAVDGLRSAGAANYIPVLLQMILTPGVDFTDLGAWPPIGSMSWSGYQRSKLFRNLGTQAFKEMAAAAGVDDDLDGRGIGVGDFDNDGRLDLLVTNSAQPSLLYRNVSPGDGGWIELRLVGTRSNRDAIGARVRVEAAGGSWVAEVDGGNGYAGQSSRVLHFGLGAARKVDAVEVRWPSGLRERFTVPVDRITTLREGDGEAER